MNYKVMQRPMFKMGGKAASQGTGITSGLDEKVNPILLNGRVIQVTMHYGMRSYQEIFFKTVQQRIK